ncbi:hypothetical protein DNTS_031520 [Danionella cerebrum]|uniref:RING-type domain-containing protein n=1 Tax=Danionella cerebrum TaxID=2873325 RepID=A0A553Q8M9_9TELE|nr:hypothetical protein DNTS_031520 [Danionella translucida]
MAERGFSLDMDQFTCSICLELLKDPVTIPCGHSYCMDCITDCWKEEDQEKVYSCPQCRQSFAPRPALNKNVMFAEVVEELKKKKEQRANLSLAEAGDVECDVCTGRKYKAIKSCLLCLNSYCHNHLEQHTIFFKDKKHELIDATGRLRRMVCGEHNRLLEVYCYTDQKCICLMCVMEEHAAHHVASVKTERAEKQADGRVEAAQKEAQVRGTLDFHEGPELVHFKSGFILGVVVELVGHHTPSSTFAGPRARGDARVTPA